MNNTQTQTRLSPKASLFVFFLILWLRLCEVCLCFKPSTFVWHFLFNFFTLSFFSLLHWLIFFHSFVFCKFLLHGPHCDLRSLLGNVWRLCCWVVSEVFIQSFLDLMILLTVCWVLGLNWAPLRQLSFLWQLSFGIDFFLFNSIVV